MKNLKTILILVSIISFGFFACEGPTGQQGLAGDDGIDGDNYVHSYFYEVNESDWEEYDEYGTVGFGYQTNLYVPEISNFILDYGAILVYLYQDGSYFPLPSTFSYSEGQYQSSYWVAVQFENIVITVQDDDGLTVNPGFQEFKIVVIEGAKSIPASLDLQNYKDVKAYYNLSEK